MGYREENRSQRTEDRMKKRKRLSLSVICFLSSVVFSSLITHYASRLGRCFLLLLRLGAYDQLFDAGTLGQVHDPDDQAMGNFLVSP